MEKKYEAKHNVNMVLAAETGLTIDLSIAQVKPHKNEKEGELFIKKQKYQPLFFLLACYSAGNVMALGECAHYQVG